MINLSFKKHPNILIILLLEYIGPQTTFLLQLTKWNPKFLIAVPVTGMVQF